MRRQSGFPARPWAPAVRWAAGLLLAAAPTIAAPGPPPPAAVALVVDASGSVSPAEIARAQALAAALLARLPAGSEAAVFSFDDEARLLQGFTAEAPLVARALQRVQRRGRFTALHDALYDASRALRDVSAPRRALVLFTDGRDENSTLTLEDGVRVAQDARIPIFTVGLGAAEERVLRRIARLTGGAYLPLDRADAAGLAGRVSAAGAETPATPGSGAAAPLTSPRAVATAAGTAPRPGRSGLVAVAVLVLAGLAGTVVWWIRARRAFPRCPACDAPLSAPRAPCLFCAEASDDAGRTRPGDLSPTVIERLDLTEEYLEKTIVLRERPLLTVTQGPGAGALFELSQRSATSIGRGRANDIVLKDVSISGQHCRIRPEKGGFVLHDLKSTNGTFVNARRVSRHALADGDRLQIGETVMEFRS